ncbi:MAG: aldo/keto reductase [Sedimentisphaerales bacterium]|nr:aldo/keto reductase [Sedimentisphaerales bacterium]
MKDIVRFDKLTINWKGERISRFVLGTAQLGMDYGIANVQGQPSERLACEIVKTALGYGVNCFDTAQAYGNSEVALGRALRYCGAVPDIKIVSKLSPKLQPTDNKAVEQAIGASCQNLGVDQLWCLMLHRADWLDSWHKGLGQTLCRSRQAGNLKYLGVSVYTPDEARRALEYADIQVVQVPCSLWNQRMLHEGIFELAKKKSKLLFVRSIYLQGLLLLSPEDASKKLPAAKWASQKWYELAAQFGMSPKQLSISFGLSLNVPLVIGVESIQQLNENAQLFQQAPLSADVSGGIWSGLSPLLNSKIVDPSLWQN